MNSTTEPFGAQLVAAMRQIPACQAYLGRLDYEAIQKLKQADREATIKMFYGSSYDLIQQLKTKEPAEIASYIAGQAADDAAAAAFVFFFT